MRCIERVPSVTAQASLEDKAGANAPKRILNAQEDEARRLIDLPECDAFRAALHLCVNERPVADVESWMKRVQRRVEKLVRTIAGLRGNVRVRAEVTADGSLTDDGDGVVNVYEPGYVPPRAQPIPAGSVALDLNASRQSEGSADFQREWIAEGFACTEDVLQEQTLEGCVEAWNGPDNGANRRLALGRVRVPAAYVILRSNEPGVSSGCFFGFLAHRGRYLFFESSWRDGGLVFAKPELGYSSQKGLDADARVRGDGTLELKRSSLNDRCEVWWNATAGWEIRKVAASRGLVAEVYAVYSSGQNSRCEYTLRTRDGFLRAVVDFRDGEWASTPLRPVEPPPRFRPNGELAASGWLSVGP